MFDNLTSSTGKRGAGAARWVMVVAALVFALLVMIAVPARGAHGGIIQEFGAYEELNDVAAWGDCSGLYGPYHSNECGDTYTAGEYGVWLTFGDHVRGRVMLGIHSYGGMVLVYVGNACGESAPVSVNTYYQAPGEVSWELSPWVYAPVCVGAEQTYVKVADDPAGQGTGIAIDYIEFEGTQTVPPACSPCDSDDVVAALNVLNARLEDARQMVVLGGMSFFFYVGVRLVRSFGA